jgi:hypothetical protein
MKVPAAVVLCLVSSLAGIPPARAEEPFDTVRSVIEQQITAFLNDDAKAAYGFASPSIRGKFASEQAFFDMVRRSYAPVYRPGNFAFGRTKATGDTVVQEVLISGPDGKDWTALYQVVKQPDGSYKINGVHMVRATPGPEI